jgi:SAM-dependent methyltransferase
MIDLAGPIVGFKESEYLEANPDVRLAIERSNSWTGWQHFIQFGFRENRPGVPLEVRRVVQQIRGYDSTTAVPPTHLRQRVHGAADQASFDNLGKILSGNLFDEIKGLPKLSVDANVLDFGCGCGRVIKPLHELCAKGKVDDGRFDWYGSDIDPEAIGWCQRFLHPIGTFVLNAPEPPLPFKNGFFHFLYSISIFTHLPEDMQLVWLDELRRVTRPNGFLVLSTHGEHLLKAPPEDKETLQTDGFFYRVGKGTPGLPSFYHTAFHTHEYIQKRWSKFFAVKKIVTRGIANNQDLVLCQRVSKRNRV